MTPKSLKIAVIVLAVVLIAETAFYAYSWNAWSQLNRGSVSISQGYNGMMQGTGMMLQGGNQMLQGYEMMRQGQTDQGYATMMHGASMMDQGYAGMQQGQGMMQQSGGMMNMGMMGGMMGMGNMMQGTNNMMSGAGNMMNGAGTMMQARNTMMEGAAMVRQGNSEQGFGMMEQASPMMSQGMGMMSGGMGMMNQGSMMMGQGMMGGGMMGGGMMGGTQGMGMMGGSSQVGNINQAVEIANRYVASLNDPDLAVKDMMEFQYNYYFIVYEKSTGIGAFEMLIMKQGGGMMSGGMTGVIHAEPGPNMMWNIKYNMMSGMMGSPWRTESASPNMPVSKDKAVELAQKYLDTSLPGTTAVDPDQFYGYYTLHIEKDGRIQGMLSVNGYTGQVWYHHWHGEFIQMQEQT